MAPMILCTKQKQIRDRGERTCGCPWAGAREWDGLGVGVGRCKHLHLEWISNGVIPHSTENYVQSLGVTPDGRRYEKKNVCVCVCVCIHT